MISLAKTDCPHANKVLVVCPRCALQYVLSYTDDEWHRLKDWTCAAERALREDHNLKHERDTMELKQKKLVRGR
jgi:hypothetical protein